MDVLLSIIISFFIRIGAMALIVFLVFDLLMHPEHFSIVSTIMVILIYRSLYKFIKNHEEYKNFIQKYFPIMLLVNILPKIMQAFGTITEKSPIYKISWSFDVIMLALLCLISTVNIEGKPTLKKICISLITIISIIGLYFIWAGKILTIHFYGVVGALMILFSFAEHFTIRL